MKSANRGERFYELTRTDVIRQDLRSKSITAAAMTAGVGFVDLGLRFVSTAVLARLILPEHFGLLMMVTAVTSVADQMRELGLSAATVQCKELTHERSTNLFWVSLSLSVAIAVLVSGFSPLIAWFYREPRLVPITCILAGNFIVGGLMTQHQALLTRRLMFGRTAFVRLSSSLLSTGAGIAFAIAGYGYWALLWREVIRAALLTLGMWLSFPWVPSRPFRNVSVRDLVCFGTDLAGANILAGIMSSADRFVLGRLWGAAPVAIYRQSYQLLLVPLDQFTFPLYQAGNPSLCMLQSDPLRYRNFFRRLLAAACLITMPASVFIALYSHVITLLLLGPRWLECAPIITLLSCATFLRQPISATLVIPITTGKSRTFFYATLAQNITFVVCLCVGAVWGPRGVAFGEATATFLTFIPLTRAATHNSPIPHRDVLIVPARIAAASIMMGIALIGYRHFIPDLSTALSLLTGAGIAIGAFLAAWLTIPGGKSEIFALSNDLARAVREKLSPHSASPTLLELPIAKRTSHKAVPVRANM